MKKIFGISLLAFLAAASIASAQDANATKAAKDPAYAQMKRLVGGVWHTGVESNTVESRWSYGPDGTTLMGETVLSMGGKKVLTMNARFGWDASAKQVYYLDAHGLDTVYFGHATAKGNTVQMEFKGLVGDPNAYIFQTSFDDDNSYDATLFMDVHGKPGKVVEKFKWTRTAE